MCTVSQDEWPNELVVNTASTGSSLPESTMSVIHVRVGLGCVRVCGGGIITNNTITTCDSVHQKQGGGWVLGATDGIIK